MSASPQVLEQLRAVDLFASLSDRDLKQVADAGRRVEHPAGHEVAVEGGGGVAFHLVLEGEAQVSVGGESRPSMRPGEYFGEISVLDAQPRTASVTAGDGGLVTFAITSWAFSGLLEKHPGMSRQVIANLCKRLRAVEAVAARSRAADVS